MGMVELTGQNKYRIKLREDSRKPYEAQLSTILFIPVYAFLESWTAF